MAAAFGLALQVLLSGVVAAPFDAGGSAHDPFVISFGSGTPADDGVPAKAPDKHPPCVLCTLAKAAHALLPTDAARTKLDVTLIAVLGPALAVRIAQYASPTGHYQRGPPARPLAG